MDWVHQDEEINVISDILKKFGHARNLSVHGTKNGYKEPEMQVMAE